MRALVRDAMNIPYVIDNLTHRLTYVLNGLIAEQTSLWFRLGLVKDLDNVLGR